MDNIVKRNGNVYLVQDFEKKGFEIYHYLGRDPDYMEEEKPKKVKNTKKEVD